MQREIYFKELSSHVMIVGAGKSEIHWVNQLAGDSGWVDIGILSLNSAGQ